MPLFEYRCAGCGEAFEELVRSPDEPVPCPACGQEGASRKLPLVRRGSGGGDSLGSSASSHASSHASGCAGCAGGSCGSCGH
jgi:putative FmdB family regulatory protein